MADITKPLLGDEVPPEEENEDDFYCGVLKSEVFDTSDNGLSEEEAAARLEKFGPNALVTKRSNKWLNLLKEFFKPMPIMIWLAIIVECAIQDWENVAVLLTLQFLNAFVGWFEDTRAGDAVDALKNSLKPEAQVKRDGIYKKISAADLVPGDIVSLNAGATVPADCQLKDGKPVSVDQAALTGESLPVTLYPDDKAMMGSNVVRGEIDALVVATGSCTFFGKTASMIASVDEMGHFQKVVLQITFGLMGISAILCGITLTYLLVSGNDILESLAFCVVLLVASIPIAMQVVCTTTMALGCKKLAGEKAIVTRLTSIEQMASMNMLCSDKTGTLTLNKMELQDDMQSYVEGVEHKDVLMYAGLAAKWMEPAKDAIDTLVLESVDIGYLNSTYELIDYMPFDPAIKRTESVVRNKQSGQIFKVAKGAPQVILNMSSNYESIHVAVETKVNDLATRGIRCLAMARTESEDGPWQYLGLLTFLDPPRPDTKETIERAFNYGVEVKMITGDQMAIAKEMCSIIGLGTNILSSENLPHDAAAVAQKSKTLGVDYGEMVSHADGFAQVYPEHKFLIVETFRQLGYVVGMTGDGVNDAPALKRADIGIAVEGATDAAQAAADIVLTAPGLSTIISAIIFSREIFQRMKNYVIYRIACTIELLLFFFVAVLFLHPSHFNHEFSDHPYFKIPVIALVVITILNDGCIISIAYDKVDPPAEPESWFLVELFLVATVLGLVAVASSIWLLILGFENVNNPLWSYFGLEKLDYDSVMMIIYLKVSISDFLTVFAARTRGFFFSRRPGLPLVLASLVALGASTILGRYWFLGNGMQPIDWKLIGFIWIYCVLWFLVQDLVKYAFYKLLDLYYWSHNKQDINKIKELKRNNRLALARDQTMQRTSVTLGSKEIPTFVNSGEFEPATALMEIARLEEMVKQMRQKVLTYTASSIPM